MSVNKHRPHLFILPEDDANRRIANGFLLDTELNLRAVQILPPSGGWMNVLNDFQNNHIKVMSAYENRYMVLLIDFDKDIDRRAKVQEVIPESLTERVFVLGVLSEPEDLRTAIHSNFEDIGTNLARDCRENTRVIWNHALLQHNAAELQRMMPILRPILFPQG